MFDSPLGQLVPLVSGASVDGQPELHVLVFALLQVCHHLLRSSDTNNQQRGPVSVSYTHSASISGKVIVNGFSKHLNNVAKVFPLNVVVCFDEDLSQNRLADGVVFGIELVKAMKSVSVL